MNARNNTKTVAEIATLQNEVRHLAVADERQATAVNDLRTDMEKRFVSLEQNVQKIAEALAVLNGRWGVLFMLGTAVLWFVGTTKTWWMRKLGME